MSGSSENRVRVGLFRLALTNLKMNLFRSTAIFLCAALIAGLTLVASLVVSGAEDNLRLNLDRFGADVVIVPWASVNNRAAQNYRLMLFTTPRFMPSGEVDRIATVKGVRAASPQLYLASQDQSPYCASGALLLVAYDPATDFMVRPWLEQPLEKGLGLGEAVVGSQVSNPQGGSSLSFYGMELTVVRKLLPSESDLDRAVLVNFDTALELIRRSQSSSTEALKIPPNSISVVLVQGQTSLSSDELSIRILDQVKGVLLFRGPGLVRAERNQLIGFIRTAAGLLGLTIGLSILFIGLVFSLSIHDRRREIGMLRALGCPRGYLLGSFLLEGSVLALSGGFLGAGIAVIALVLFRNFFIGVLHLPLQSALSANLPGFSLIGMLLALCSVAVAVLVPSLRILRKEIAWVMRE